MFGRTIIEITERRVGQYLNLSLTKTMPAPNFINVSSGLSLLQTISCTIIHSSDKLIRNVNNRIYILYVHGHKYQLYLCKKGESERQTVVNEPIYDGISYFIFILILSTTN